MWFAAVSEGKHRRGLRGLLQPAARHHIAAAAAVHSSPRTTSRSGDRRCRRVLGLWFHRPPPRLWSVPAGEGPGADDWAGRVGRSRRWVRADAQQSGVSSRRGPQSRQRGMQVSRLLLRGVNCLPRGCSKLTWRVQSCSDSFFCLR